MGKKEIKRVWMLSQMERKVEDQGQAGRGGTKAAEQPLVSVTMSVSQGSSVMVVKHFNFMNHIHSGTRNLLAKKKIRNWTFFFLIPGKTA